MINKTNLSQLYKVVYWETKKRFYDLRILFSVYLIILVFINILPYDACQYLEAHVHFLVSIIDTTLFTGIISGIFLMPYFYLSKPYRSTEYRKEKKSTINTKLRIFSKVFVNFIQTGFILLINYFGFYGMQKFATSTETYSYLPYDYGYTLLLYGLLCPMVYLSLVLTFYNATNCFTYVLPYIIATSSTSIPNFVYDILNLVPKSMISIPLVVPHIIRIAIILLVTCFFFLKACHYEDRI